MLLLVEVGDTSARFDREVKLPLYAATGIPEIWLLDVNARTISVFREPGPGGYGTVATARPGDELRPGLLPGAAVAAADLLG